jgi:hypothetical protein
VPSGGGAAAWRLPWLPCRVGGQVFSTIAQANQQNAFFLEVFIIHFPFNWNSIS